MINRISGTVSPDFIKTDFPLFFFEETDSTNERAKIYFLENHKAALFVAKHQTSGRGRKGRSFSSRADNGAYFSLVLPIEKVSVPICSVTPAAAVAVATAIEKQLGKTALIKWVNDIFYDGKKVGGILTEAITEGSGITGIVIGIGVNTGSDFDDGTEQIAGFVSVDGSRLICDTVKNLDDIFAGKKEFFGDYEKRQFLIGKEVFFGKKSGFAVGISEKCELIVDCGGEKVYLSSGEVTLGSGRYCK